MQKFVLAFLLAVSLSAAGAIAADGLVSIQSPHPARETMDRFQELVKAKGLNVFLRVDHAAGAQKVGKSLRPTELLIFGNPQGEVSVGFKRLLAYVVARTHGCHY
jgi:hypothetical protein